MWTRKAAFTFTGGIALILIGMMISNHQMMILGLAFIAFIVVNSWVSGHGDVEVQRTLSADNLYKGDDLYVELLVTNRSRRKTQQLEVYDNVPHEMKLRSGLNQMRLNLKPGESARIRYVLRCPLRGHYSVGPVSLRYRNTFNLSVDEMYVDHHSDIIIFPQIRDVEDSSVLGQRRCTLVLRHCERLDLVLSSIHFENMFLVTHSRISTGRRLLELVN